MQINKESKYIYVIKFMLNALYKICTKQFEIYTARVDIDDIFYVIFYNYFVPLKSN